MSTYTSVLAGGLRLIYFLYDQQWLQETATEAASPLKAKPGMGTHHSCHIRLLNEIAGQPGFKEKANNASLSLGGVSKNLWPDLGNSSVRRGH